MSILLIVACLFIVLRIGTPFFKTPATQYPPGQPYRVKYLKGPESKDYLAILLEIEACTDKKQIYNAYLRILIFQGTYPHSEALLSDLMDLYLQKETTILSSAFKLIISPTTKTITAMTENEIRKEIKKATDFYLDKTYDISDLQNHILHVIRENSDTGAKHVIQLERLIFKLYELRENQRLFWAGHKSKLPLCKSLEAALDKKIQFLLSAGGYSIERYKKNTNQNSLFQ